MVINIINFATYLFIYLKSKTDHTRTTCTVGSTQKMHKYTRYGKGANERKIIIVFFSFDATILVNKDVYI